MPIARLSNITVFAAEDDHGLENIVGQEGGSVHKRMGFIRLD